MTEAPVARILGAFRQAGIMPSEFLLIFCNCPDRDSAHQIAQALVEAGLAACVSQVPGITSTYRWAGKLCHDEEVMLLIKSRAEQLAQIEDRVAELHPYELPEVIAVPITAGSRAYLDWVASNLTPTGK